MWRAYAGHDSDGYRVPRVVGYYGIVTGSSLGLGRLDQDFIVRLVSRTIAKERVVGFLVETDRETARCAFSMF